MSENKTQIAKSESTKKKISFLSAIMLVIGSSIGAGIFLKNGEILKNTGGSLVFALISWIVSIIGVICMGVSLAEVGSASTDSNLGIVSWVQKFCHRYLFKASKYFMAFLYLPLNFFLMPYYAVLQFQDAFGWQTNWWIAALIAFAITAWFFIVSGLSSKMGNIQNWITTCLKFIPLAFTVIAGITLACCGHSYIGKDGGPSIIPSAMKQSGHMLLAKMYPVLGIFGSIPAIIFSFDGFYSAAGIQTKMEEPKKTPIVLVIGLLIVASVDLLISISLLIGSKSGTVSSLAWFDANKYHWVIGLCNILIAIGILGIINGFAMYNPLYYEELIQMNELPFSSKIKSKINPNKPIVGLIYAGIITAVFFIVFTIIGALAFSDTSGYGSTPMTPMNWVPGIKRASGYGIDKIGNLNSLYSLADLIANWTSIFAFLFIVFAIIGAIINRKTNKVQVNQVKGFKACSIISSIVIGIAILFIVVSTFANIGITASWHKDIGKDEYTQQNWNTDLLGSIMTLIVMIIFIGVSCIPSAIEMHKEKQLALNSAK